jgi:hypothetical protein
MIDFTVVKLGFIENEQTAQNFKEALESSGHWMNFQVTLGVAPGPSKYVSVLSKEDVTEMELLKAAMMTAIRKGFQVKESV